MENGYGDMLHQPHGVQVLGPIWPCEMGYSCPFQLLRDPNLVLEMPLLCQAQFTAPVLERGGQLSQGSCKDYRCYLPLFLKGLFMGHVRYCSSSPFTGEL